MHALFSFLDLDYTQLSDTVDLDSSTSRECVFLTIITDLIDENDETLTITIENDADWPEFRNSTQVTIIDNGKYS